MLPRRAFIGLSVAEGVRVTGVLDGGAALAAGVRPDDQLIAVGGREVSGVADVVEAARAVRGLVTFRVARGGRELELSSEAPPLPAEPGVSLGHVVSRGARLRTMVAAPNGSGHKAGVLFLQGIRPLSCESPLGPSPIRAMSESFVRAGFVVMRLERAGVGDSEGPSPRVTGLDVEIDGYRAAFEALALQVERVFLVGHSFGGMVAPLLDVPAAGICVLGSSAKRWYACMRGSTARQTDMPPDVAALWTKLLALVFEQGLTPARAFQLHADLRPLESPDCEGETMHGRAVSLLRELDARDLRAAWRSVRAPVTAIHGEHDRICTLEDAREIASLTGGRSLEVEGSSHDLDAPNLAASVQFVTGLGCR